MPPLAIEDFTVGWICALPVELAAAEQLLDERYDSIPNVCTQPFVLGRIGQHNIVIGSLPAGFMGTNPAAIVAANMASVFKSLQIRLLVGVGGGVPSAQADVRLGDVVISQPNNGHGGVVQYDFGKAELDGQFRRTGFLGAPPKALLDALTNLQADMLRKRGQVWSYLSAFQSLPEFNRDRLWPDNLFRADSTHCAGPTCEGCDQDAILHRTARQDGNPVIHYGTVASGNQLVKDGVARDQQSFALGGVLCFEMEAAGLMNNFPSLVIRGISDYADSHKNKTWQPYAAATAAATAKAILLLLPSAVRSGRQRPGMSIVAYQFLRCCVGPVWELTGSDIGHKTKSLFTVPFSRDKSFIGREKVLADVQANVNSCVQSEHRRTALVGLGGIG
jgi:nucleoside phosphorylase